MYSSTYYCYYYCTIILCLVVGLHKRTALRCTSWIFGMQQKRYPCPTALACIATLTTEVETFCRLFFFLHGTHTCSEYRIRLQFVPFWGPNERKSTKEQPSIQASFSFLVRHARWWRGNWFDHLLPALHISSHRLGQRNTVMASHISLALDVAGGLCKGKSTNIQRAEPLRPICISSASSDLVSSTMCHGKN